MGWHRFVRRLGGVLEKIGFRAKLDVGFAMLHGYCGAACCPFLKNSAILPKGVFVFGDSRQLEYTVGS